MVREILSAEGYGIIENPDGEDIYFHRNAVKDMAFDDLVEGDSVMYAEKMGEKGLQAVWMRRSRRSPFQVSNQNSKIIIVKGKNC